MRSHFVSLPHVAVRRPYRLIARHGKRGTEPFTLRVDGRGALPIFGHADEAITFLKLVVSGDGWQVREATTGGLISVLVGPCAGVERVVLDPWPGTDTHTVLGLASMDREEFLELLVEESASSDHETRKRVRAAPSLRLLAGGRHGMEALGRPQDGDTGGDVCPTRY